MPKAKPATPDQNQIGHEGQFGRGRIEDIIKGDKKNEVKVTTNLARARGDQWMNTYFDHLAITGQITKAALAAKISHRTVARRRLSDPEFAREEEVAMREANRLFESEAIRRATEGCRQEFYNAKGVLSSIKIEYSDTLLLRLLERMETGSWRQRQQVEMGTPGAFATRSERKDGLEKIRKEIEDARARGQKQGVDRTQNEQN